MDIDDTAPVITRDRITINAPAAVIWEVQTAPAGWPKWLRDIDSATGPAPLKVGSVFEWQTQGLSIVSTVAEIDPGARVVWGGPADGIVAVHAWTLTDTDAGVVVSTEESWAGPAVETNVPVMQAALDASLRGWLEDLKAEAERRGNEGKQ